MTPETRRRLAHLAGQLALAVAAAKDPVTFLIAEEARALLDAADTTWWAVICGNDGNGVDYDQGYGDGYDDGHTDGRNATRALAPTNWRSLARELVSGYELSEWEQEFLTSFLDRGWSIPSEKQRAVFVRIASGHGIEITN